MVKGDRLYRIAVYGLGWLAVAFMVAPVAVGLVMSFTAGQTLKFPPDGFSLRWYTALFDPVRSAPIHAAIWNSLQIAVLTVLGAFLFAMPAAYGATRLKGKVSAIVEPLMLAPLVLPTLVYGLAALIAFSNIGLRPSLPLVVLGHVVVFGPLMYRACIAIAQRLDPSLEEASTLLGVGAFMTFLRITLPLMVPGILAGAFLVFMQSLDNVSVSLFLADARTSVLPLRMFQMIEESLDVRVAAISGVLIGVVFVGLFFARRVLEPTRAS
ncbi:MAG: ABC transporter permease [Alphaproteobacteria bacterium]|nr:ABC transporter permease [Alphaproteobacteria bacterium]